MFQDKLEVFQYTRSSILVNKRKYFMIQEKVVQYIQHLHILKVHCDFFLLFVILVTYSLYAFYIHRRRLDGDRRTDGRGRHAYVHWWRYQGNDNLR